jgi:anti-sigma B factor antagonist
MNASAAPQDAFTFEHHGEVLLIVGSGALETVDPDFIEQATRVLLEAIRHRDDPLIVIDLAQVDYFGSTFLALLLRCWKQVKVRGGLMVLSGVSERARELLRITSLDMIWPSYSGRREANESLLAD